MDVWTSDWPRPVCPLHRGQCRYSIHWMNSWTISHSKRINNSPLHKTQTFDSIVGAIIIFYQLSFNYLNNHSHFHPHSNFSFIIFGTKKPQRSQCLCVHSYDELIKWNRIFVVFELKRIVKTKTMCATNSALWRRRSDSVLLLLNIKILRGRENTQ